MRPPKKGFLSKPWHWYPLLIPGAVIMAWDFYMGHWKAGVIILLSWPLGWFLGRTHYERMQRRAEKKTYGYLFAWLPLTSKRTGGFAMHWLRMPLVMEERLYDWKISCGEYHKFDVLLENFHMLEEEMFSLVEIWEDDFETFPRWVNDEEKRQMEVARLDPKDNRKMADEILKIANNMYVQVEEDE